MIQKASFLGGVNLLRDPRAIDDSELTLAKNVVPVRPGILGKRLALGYALDTNVSPGGGNPLACIEPPFSSAGVFATRSILNKANTRLFVLTDRRGTTYAVPDLFGVPTRYRPSFASGPALDSGGIIVSGATSALYAFGGFESVNNGIVIRATGSGYTGLAFAFQGAQSNAIKPYGVAQYRSRYVYFNLGPGLESSMVFSDPFQPTLVGANAISAARVDCWLGDGDRIVACAEILLTSVGSLAQSALLILKENSAYLMTGEPPSTTNAQLTYTISRYAFNCGCSSPETVSRSPMGLFWAGPDDVWFFPWGQVPMRVGTKIRPRLQETPAAARYLWHAAYYNGFYRLAIFSPGQGPTDDDPCGEQWWLDVREGYPEDFTQAHWWGPQIYNVSSSGGGVGYSGTRCMAVDLRNPPSIQGTTGLISGTTPLIGFETSALESGASGITMVSYDVPNARDETSRSMPAGVRFWRPAQNVGLGDVVVATDANWNGHYFTCTTAGTSGAIEPSWNTGTGGTTGDNTVVWKEGPADQNLIVDGVAQQQSGVVSSQEILSDIRTKEYDGGDPLIQKIYKGTELAMTVSRDTQIFVDAIMDRGASVDTQSVGVQLGGTGGTALMLNSGVSLGGIVGQPMADPTSRFIVRPNSAKRDVGGTIQLRLYDQAGAVILAGVNDTIIFTTAAGLYLTTVAAGFYASKSALGTAIATAMSTAAGQTFYFDSSSNANTNAMAVRSTAGFTMNFQSGGTILNGPLAGTAVTATQTNNCKRLFGGIFGFDISVDYPGVISGIYYIANASPGVYPNDISTWLLTGVSIKAAPIPRRPA